MTVSCRLQDWEFEWDDQKARSNLEKHGITFEEAAEAFLDPFSRMADASVAEEIRDAIVGYSYAQRLLLVVFVERAPVTRIVSARPATRAERRDYERLG